MEVPDRSSGLVLSWASHGICRDRQGRTGGRAYAGPAPKSNHRTTNGRPRPSQEADGGWLAEELAWTVLMPTSGNLTLHEVARRVARSEQLPFSSPQARQPMQLPAGPSIACPLAA